MPKTKEVICPVCGINGNPVESDAGPDGECQNCGHLFRPAELGVAAEELEPEPEED